MVSTRDLRNLCQRVCPARWLPLLVGIALATAALFLWRALLVQEQQQIERTIRSAAARVKSEIVARMDARILALVRMAKRWERWADRPPDDWQFEAGLSYRHFPGYQAIMWVDPSFAVRWVVPPQGNQLTQSWRANYADQRKAMETARQKRALAFTGALDLAGGGKGFAVSIPLFQREELTGFVNAVFHFQDLFDTILDNTVLGYGVAVFAGEETIYRRAADGGRHERTWGQEEIVEPYGLTWRVRVWPQTEILAVEHSVLPTVAFATGLLLAGLSAAMVALAQTARRRAREAEAAHWGLSLQMAERQRTEEALRESERLAALGTSAAKLAHEISNPLNGISTTVQFLERRFTKHKESKEDTLLTAVQDIKNEINRLKSLLQEFRSLSRSQQLNLQPVDLAGVVQESLTIEAAQYTARRIRIEHDFPAELSRVLADSEKLKQVLLNLYKNAVEAMPKGGTLTVRARNAGEQVLLEVIDTGVGAPQGVDIFKLFTTTKFEGTGLGLAIVQQIVTAHGGAITYTSTPGQGTTCTLTLPTVPFDSSVDKTSRVEARDAQA